MTISADRQAQAEAIIREIDFNEALGISEAETRRLASLALFPTREVVAETPAQPVEGEE